MPIVKPLISIIIPVYNAEETLHIALESLIKQTYSNLEVIIINDCSVDSTLTIVDGFVPTLTDKGFNIQVINHTQNEGVAAARNTGLNHATGAYIGYIDADDWLDANAIELTIAEVLRTDADIIGFNWWLSFENKERKMNQPPFSTPKEAIQQMLAGKMRWNLWLFIVRRSLYEDHNIRFIPGKNMGEDLMVMVKLFVKAARVSYLHNALYHYGQSNSTSLTKVYSSKHIEEVTTNVQEVEDYLLKNNFIDHLDRFISFLKLNIKLPLLISDKKSNYQQWLSWFPEANSYIMANKVLPIRTRLLQWFAAKKQFWLVKLYYKIVIRFVYGFLYN